MFPITFLDYRGSMGNSMDEVQPMWPRTHDLSLKYRTSRDSMGNSIGPLVTLITSWSAYLPSFRLVSGQRNQYTYKKSVDDPVIYPGKCAI